MPDIPFHEAVFFLENYDSNAISGAREKYPLIKDLLKSSQNMEENAEKESFDFLKESAAFYIDALNAFLEREPNLSNTISTKIESRRRTKIASEILTLLSSGGLIATISMGADDHKLILALLAFGSSLLSILLQNTNKLIFTSLGTLEQSYAKLSVFRTEAKYSISKLSQILKSSENYSFMDKEIHEAHSIFLKVNSIPTKIF